MSDPRPALNAVVASVKVDAVQCGVMWLWCQHCDTTFHEIGDTVEMSVIVNEGRKHAAVCASWPAPPYPPARRKAPRPIPGQLVLTTELIL